jgi:hypothetical protein
MTGPNSETPADGGAPASPDNVAAPPVSATPTDDGQQSTGVSWSSKPSIHVRTSTLKVYDLKSPTLFPVPSVVFEITLKKKTSKTTIEIRDDTTVIRSQEFTSGELIESGYHTWVWDGYGNDNRLDTRMLRRKKLAAYVRTDDGEDNATLRYHYDDSAWADVRVYLDANTRSIDILLYVTIAASILPGKRPSNEEVAKASGQIRTGIKRYWSRSSAQDTKRKIAIDGVDYDVTATALDADTGAAVAYTIESGGYFSDRACNFGAFASGMDVHLPVPGSSEDDQQHTAAHELGHSVLREAIGPMYSVTHKGSSTLVQRPIEGHLLPAAGEVDLMQYYAAPRAPGEDLRFAPYDAGTYARCNAVEDDVKALLACVKVGFESS